MKIKKSFIRIALAAGLVGIAACSGSSASDSTVVRQKNAALATNVQKYVGSATSENWEDDSNTDYTNVAFRKDDKYQFSFDLNLDAVDANTNAPTSVPECWVETDGKYNRFTGTDCDAYPDNTWNRRSLEVDFRSAFSNFSVSGVPTNAGTKDLSTIKWAKCPLVTEFYPKWEQWTEGDTNESYREKSKPVTNESAGLYVTFVEAPNDSFVTADCNAIPAATNDFYDYTNWYENYRKLYDENGVGVPVTGVAFTVSFDKWNNDTQNNVLATVPAGNSTPTLKDILPTGMNSLMSDPDVHNYMYIESPTGKTESYTWEDVTYTYPINDWSWGTVLSLSSAKVKDYAPFDLAATADASGISTNWKRSADLEATDVTTHVLEWSTDGFTNQIETLNTYGEALSLPSCAIDPNDSIKVNSDISVRLYALDQNGIPSASTDVVTVKKAAGAIVCPTATLGAPQIVASSFSIENMEYTISWTAPADAGTSEITYCVDSSSDAFATEDAIYSQCGITETTVNLWYLGPTISFRVTASTDTGTVSKASAPVVVKAPETKAVTNVKSVLTEDGLKVSWVNTQLAGVDKKSAIIRWGLVADNVRGPEIGQGYVYGSNLYTISIADLSAGFIPGSTMWVDVQACSQFDCGAEASTTYEYLAPSTVVEPVTTGDSTAKAAVVAPGASQVQLPANQNITITVNSAEVAKGFAVPETDIKAIEYRVAKGVWKALSKQASVNIPKSASNFSVRVTKNDGKTLVSDKKIVRSGAYSVKAGATTSKAKLLSLANLKAPAGSKYAVTVSGKGICKVAGTGVKAVKKGACSAKVSVTPTGKKATSKTVKITVK
jgi:hypothetical protein